MHFAGPTSQHQGLGKSRTNDDQQPFELSQYSPIGVQHFSAQYKDDPKALEKLSRRICSRVEQDSSDLITFCDKRIRKRRKKAKQDEEAQQQRRSRSRSGRKHQEQENDGLEASAPAPEVVKASDLLLGTCLGQGSFSSVFVLEKHLHRRSSAAVPRRGRRSKLAHGTNQGSTSSRGASLGNFGESSVSNRSSTKSRTGRRRLRQRPSTNDHKNGHGNIDGSHRSDTNSSSSSSTRSRSLSLPRTYKTLNNHHNLENESSTPVSPRGVLSPSNKSNNESFNSTRSRSLSSSIRNGIRAVFRRKEKDSNNSNSNHSSMHQDPSPNKSRRRGSHSLRRRDRSEDNSIFRGGSRSLSCRRRRSHTRRSKSQDGLTNTEMTSDMIDSTNSSDDSLPESTHKGVLWKNFDASDDDEGNSNLVVKILQPKLMDQPKLFANCAAGLIREGLFLASLDHPHVLKVHAWTSPNGWMDFAALSIKEGDLYDGYLLVLERLKGGSLKGWMHKWQQEHREEQQAIAAVAAMEVAEEKKRERSHRRLRPRKPGRLSFTSSSSDSGSFSMSMSNHSTRLRHTILKKKDARSSSCNSPRPSLEELSPTPLNDASGRGERSFPYTSKCPTTQLSDRMSLLLQLSDTVKYLHKHRILHRDLKPDNLGVTFVDNHSDSGNNKQKNYPSKMSLKIFDFDIARLVPEEDPKEVNVLSIITSSSKKKKHKRSSSSGSVRSWDPEMLNRDSEAHHTASNRGGRSISPLRTSSSSTGDPTTLRRRTKGKYRGQRPRPQANHHAAVTERARTYHERSTPEPVTPERLASETPKETPKDTLFEMTAKMGSPRYMAPEIARGEPYNLKSEVYTVALLVHEVLTLQKPYDELQPQDHGKLVHFDLPGYRPPIFPGWKWPAELEEVLHRGWGDITQRPSMKEIHSVLKRALPKLCPELNHVSTTPSQSTQPSPPSSISRPTPQISNRKGRSLFHRSEKKTKQRKEKAPRGASLTPTKLSSDFSLTNDDHFIVQ